MDFKKYIEDQAARLQIVDGRLDAAESAFFARELEHIKTSLYDIKYPELRARLFIPVDGSAGPGAESITYYQFDKAGMAKLVKDYADDLPRADVVGNKFTSPVESIGNSYAYSLQEVRASQMAGRSLPNMKAMSARRAHEQKVDEIAAVGDVSTGLGGMLNNANVPQASIAAGVWATAAADKILGDMNELVDTMIDDTNAAETPDTLLVPPAQFSRISSLRVGDTGETVLSHFLRTNPFIRDVDHWYRLKGAGAGATDRMVGYRRDPSVLTLEIPQEFEQLPVQSENLAFKVPLHSRIGGVIIYRPLTMSYRDGL